VLVRIATVVHGASVGSQILLGVLEGSTVRGRSAGLGGVKEGTALIATSQVAHEAIFIVTGLTPGASLTWDAAWGIETFTTSSLIKYGGPNNTTTNDAFGAIAFEVWDYPPIASVTYDPSTRASTALSRLKAMTAIDTTNLASYVYCAG
jgi:hypothetical protein